MDTDLPRRPALLAVAAACAALALPGLASAQDFCVGGPAGCTGTPVAANDLKAALTAAQSNGTDDRFFLAPGLYSADTFSHKSPEQVQIIGAGAGKTTMRGNLAGESVLWLEGNAASSVSSLTVEPTGDMLAGLRLEGAHARQVTVGVNGTGFSGYGAALLGGATFDDGRVDLGTNSGYAVGVLYAGAVTGSTLHAPTGIGVLAAGGTATVRRSTLSAGLGATADSSHLTIADSVINGGQVGAAADPSAAGASPTVDLERVTIAGAQLGVYAQADDGESATVHVHDSVISGSGTPVARMASNGATRATVTTDHSDYPAPAQPIDVGPGKLVETNHWSVDPRFVDESAGDFHLAADSPLIDAGTPDSVPADAIDREGNPRASDGDGDCTRVPDIGAFEYQGTKVRAVATAAAATASAGQAVGFSADGSCIPGPGAPTVTWSFDDGASAAGAAVTHAFATAGRHTATATVSDGAGHHAVATAAVDVTTPAGDSPSTTGSPLAPARPAISGLTITPRRIAIGTRLPKLVASAAKAPTGTITFTLSKPATVQLSFTRIRKDGRTTPLKTRIRITANKGVNRLRFAARLTRRIALKPGAHTLTMVATDSAGARSKPAKARFTAIRAARR